MICQEVAQLDQQVVVIDQGFCLLEVDVAALQLRQLVVDVDQMRIFELEQVAQRGLLVVRHAEDFRYRLLARKALLFGIEPHVAADDLNHVFAIGAGP